MRISVSLVLVLIYLMSCNNPKKGLYADAAPYPVKSNEEHPGKKLMENNCYVCHNLADSHDNLLAPPMIAVKHRYTSLNPTKAEFIESIQSWIKNPNADDAKMYGAVKRFNVMPKMIFSDESIIQIADYMFDYDIAKPDWFELHFNEMKGNEN